MLAHPLTDMRRPALAHTSALATPAGWIVTTAAGTAVTAKTVAAARAHDRVQCLIDACLLTGVAERGYRSGALSRRQIIGRSGGENRPISNS